MGNEGSMEYLREYIIGEFRGTFPDVPIAEGVSLDDLRLLDGDPLFVTLPVIPKVGNVSKNGLLYDDALVSSIEEQINQKRPGGIFGHLKDEDRSTAFPMPSGMWVGAKRIGETLWAKAWIPAGAAKEYIKQLKVVGGSIATSIYGKGDYENVKDGVRRLKNFTLESLDFAPPERAALGYGAMPFVTAELETPEQGKESDMDKTQILAELTASDIPQNVRESIIADYRKQSEEAGKVAELTTTLSETVKELSEVKTKLSGYEITIAEYQAREFATSVETRIAELTDWKVSGDEAMKKLQSFRKTLKNQLLANIGSEREPAKVQELVSAVWEDLKPLAETVRDALAGPAAVIAAKVRETDDGKPKLVITPEAVAQARAQFSFTI